MNRKANSIKDVKYLSVLADMVDQCLDVMLNLRQSGHPGGSRSKVYPMLVTMLSGVMRYDIRNPEKRFADRFILTAGHTNPMIYSILAVLNEALRRKYKETLLGQGPSGQAEAAKKYLNPKGDKFTLVWEDLLTLRNRGGLSGHAEMEGKTLFFKFNTGPSGHGSPAAVGEALALKYAGYDDVKVFAIEGEGGLTTGVTHEAKNSAYGLGLGNLVFIVDWNDFGIDARPFSDIVKGSPEDWFSPYGWHTEKVKDGEDLDSIIDAYDRLLDDNKNEPKVLWLKTRKGRGYGKYDNASHGAAHKRNSKEFWDTKKKFFDKYNLKSEEFGKPDTGYDECKEQMSDILEQVFSLYDKEEGLLDYVAERLIELGDSVPTEEKGNKVFNKNPLNDSEIFNFENYPKEMFLKAGEKAPNSQGLFNFGSWINTYCQKNYNRPLFLACSADLAGSTKIDGFAKGWDGEEDFGMYHREKNPKGVLFPQGITEFANAAIMCGVSAVNFSKNPYEEWNGFLSASSTYASFSYLKYGALRLYSQMQQDSQIKLGKTVYVAGHSGPETAEDSRTHFGIFAPGVTQLFPKGSVVNIHPWEYNEVPVMMAAALKSSFPIIVLHLTRPAIEVPDREALGMDSYMHAAKGAYIIKDYDESRPKEGVVLVRGSKAVDNLITILPRIKEDGPNIKIVAALSSELFSIQDEEYKERVWSKSEMLDTMIITTYGIELMSEWISHPIVKEYSLSPDYDNRWRTGGSVDEIMDESGLSPDQQWAAICMFADDRSERMDSIMSTMPKE